MAKKKENIFSYGSSAIPQRESKYSVIRFGFGGINRTNEIDSGEISDCAGVVIEPPFVSPSLLPHFITEKSNVISIFGFDDKLFIIYRDAGKIKIDCRLKNGTTYTGSMGNALGTNDDFAPRTMVQFNVASNTENIVEATYIRKLLIFPDSYSIDLNITGNFEPAYLGDTYPDIKYASVYASRVFGVDENLVYASSYNDYANWNLDTAEEHNEANAWVSMSQSNVKADGEFTAIATYDNHVVLFKKDFMQLVYNNKNPFRIVDVGAWGCDNPYAVAETEGLLYFASSDAVYIYTGGTPKEISKPLDIKSYRGARLGAWEGTLYLYIDNNIYTYKNGVWSSLGSHGGGVKQFASLEYGIAALLNDNSIVFLDWVRDGSGVVPDSWAAEYGTSDGSPWWFESELIASGRLDIRRVKKISLLCDIKDGAKISVYVLKNGEEFDRNTSQFIGDTDNVGRVMFRAAVRQTSAYMHRIRVEGTGYVKILVAELQASWGGDLFVEG